MTENPADWTDAEYTELVEWVETTYDITPGDDITPCDAGVHTPNEDADEVPVYCVHCGLEGDEVWHKGHFSNSGWWCDTCNSPYCELA